MKHHRSPIRVGLIGANPTRGWGLWAHIPAIKALDEFELRAVATTRLESARATAEAFGVPLAFADATELVQHPDIDVVSITVKVPYHDTLIRAALAAGKHVYSEWPLGISLEQAKALAKLADEAGVCHVVGLQGTFAPGARFVRALIDRGVIGRPLGRAQSSV